MARPCTRVGSLEAAGNVSPRGMVAALYLLESTEPGLQFHHHFFCRISIGSFGFASEKEWMQFVWDFFEKHSRSGPDPMGNGIRLSTLAALLAVILGSAYGLSALITPANYVDPIGLELSGEWDFQNGARKNGDTWNRKVKVPKPLAPQLGEEELASEIWYRRTFSLSKALWEKRDELWLSLGSIKGAYTISIDGKYVASGDGLGPAVYKIPPNILDDERKNHELTVRVTPTEGLFPGIVHFTPMQLARSRFLQRQILDYYFQVAAKPLIPAVFRWVLFMAFAALFIAMPIRREYLYFSLYAFFSGLAALSWWRFFPLYEDFFAKKQFLFVSTLMAHACIPIFVVEFFRLRKAIREFAFVYSGVVVSLPLLSEFFLHAEEKKIVLQQLVYNQIPYFVMLPAAAFSLLCTIYLRNRIRVGHRFVQGAVLSICLAASTALEAGWLKNGVSFERYLTPEYLDLTLFLALAVLMIGDFRSLNYMFLRTKESLPSIVQKLVLAGIKQSVQEFRAVVLVVDTVGYTKKIATMTSEERDIYNRRLKGTLQPIVDAFGGERISDTGDGLVAVWNLPADAAGAESSRKSAIEAAMAIAENGERDNELRFRVGLAEGTVKCLFESPNYSFLGDPINVATRLEAAASPNEVLVHESLPLSKVSERGFYEGQEQVFVVKGANYRGRAVTRKFPPAA